MSGCVRVLLGLLSAGGLLLSCSKSETPAGPGGGGGGDGDGTSTPPEVFEKTTFNPQLVVVDGSGAPIADAAVVFGSLSVKSKADGTATLPEQDTEKSTVVTVK